MILLIYSKQMTTIGWHINLHMKTVKSIESSFANDDYTILQRQHFLSKKRYYWIDLF
jgi:hypothetical protein